MTAPTITHVHRTRAGNWLLLFDDGAFHVALTWTLSDELARYGLRLTIPDDVQPGWVGIPEPIPAPPPLPEQWINLYPNGAAGGHVSRSNADRYVGLGRIAVVHVWTDADGDHAEVIRT